MPRRSQIALTKKIVDQAEAGTCVWDCQVPGFGARAYPSGLKSFFLQYRTREGRQGKAIIGRFPSMTVDEARKEARQLRNDVDRGGDPARGRKAKRDAATVHEAVDYYLTAYATASGMKPQTAVPVILDNRVDPFAGRISEQEGSAPHLPAYRLADLLFFMEELPIFRNTGEAILYLSKQRARRASADGPIQPEFARRILDGDRPRGLS